MAAGWAEVNDEDRTRISMHRSQTLALGKPRLRILLMPIFLTLPS
jgi:hypothetical protein